MASLKNQQLDGGHATEKFYIPKLLKSDDGVSLTY